MTSSSQNINHNQRRSDIEPDADRVAVVVGATGAVGEGIALSLLNAGWQLHVIGRNAAKLENLLYKTSPHLHRHLHLHVQSFEDEESMNAACQAVLAISGHVDMVVASIGSWWQGSSLAQTTLADWRKVMRDNIETHFLCAKQWWPVLLANSQAAYVMINGSAALTPVPHAGPSSVAAGAQLIMKNALAAESHNKSPRVYGVLANTPIITRDRMYGKAHWINTQDVADACLSCYADTERLHHGATLVLNEKTIAKGHDLLVSQQRSWHDIPYFIEPW